MPDSDSNTEIKAIESAYADHVKGLFIALTAKLINQPITHLTDRQCADEFALGVNTAKRARQLAINKVSNPKAIAADNAIAAAPKPQKPVRSRKRK